MAFIEQFESRKVTMGNNPSAELRYKVTDTTSDTVARIIATTSTATTFDVYGDASVVLWRERIDIEPISDDMWEAIVYYSAIVLPVNESSFSFDTGGGSQHITQSIQTVQSVPAPPAFSAPNYKGAIGATADGVDGVDIVVPVYQFTETHVFASSAVDGAYKATLFALTGRTNDDTFRGFEAGEVLFLGAGGGKRGNENWEIQFRFAASPNATGLAIGDITGINKKGWEYLWVRYKDEVDGTANALVKTPQAVYVEKVYYDGDLSLLGIGTS